MFRIYSVGVFAGVLVHVIALVTGKQGLHRVGFYITVAAFGIGCVPVLGATAYGWFRKRQ